MADEVRKAVGEFIRSRVEEFENRVPKPIAAAIQGALRGALDSVCLELFYKYLLPTSPDQEFLSGCGGYRPLMHWFMLGSGIQKAPGFIVSSAVAGGLSCAVTQLKGGGEQDVQACMVGAFGAAVTLSLMTGVRGPEVISAGVMLSLLAGGLFMAAEKLSEVTDKYVSRDKTRNKFSSIGLGIDHHATNFNTCFFTGNALSLLNDHRKETEKGGRKT